MLDPAPPALLHPVFAEAVDPLTRIDGGLDVFRRLDAYMLIALDVSAASTTARARSIAAIAPLAPEARAKPNNFHSMLAASLVAPGHNKVIRHRRIRRPRNT